jgi:hypothetical protein
MAVPTSIIKACPHFITRVMFINHQGGRAFAHCVDIVEGEDWVSPSIIVYTHRK